jgi:hypothetical protein
MKLDKRKLWNILEKYDSPEYKAFCDGISRIIQNKSTSGDLLDIFTYMEKIEIEDRDIIEQQIGNDITTILFCI